MTKYLLLLPLLMAGSANATSLRYAVVDREGTHFVRPENLDKILRDIPADKVGAASKYLAVRPIKMENGEYMLKAHVKGLGGGPVLGAVAWGTTWVAGASAIVALVIAEGPIALAHAPEILEVTAAAANTLFLAGSVAPTP